MGVAARSSTSNSQAPRVIAFHLPQYHPIAENDRWWGPGFTEWTNVARARPLYPGHDQPHLPADLGFYDLRLAETRAAQAALAQRYGVTAFCYWHYWFAGHELLERPVREIVASGEPDMPFCLGWANETWTGIWHGTGDRVLIEQTYPGPEDDAAHFASLEAAFHDERYLKVDGRPLFYVFQPGQLPDPTGWCARWQRMARDSGLPGLHLVAEISDVLGRGPICEDPLAIGFDGGVYVRFPVETGLRWVVGMGIRRNLTRGPQIYRYRRTPVALPQRYRTTSVYPAVLPNWDSTPRGGRRGFVIGRSHPDLFGRHVAAAVRAVADRPADHRLLFVKSWNEWAEGNHLEPDLEHGHAWLRSLADAVQGGT